MFNIFKKKYDSLSWCIPKLRNPKNVVRWISKKSRFRGSFEKQHGKRVLTLQKSGQQHFQHIYWSLSRQLPYKKYLLVRGKFLSFFLNTLTTDDNYSLLNRDNSTQPIQILLPTKQKYFSEFFAQRRKSSLNFEHFQKNYDHNSWCISDITDSKKRS